MPTMGMPSTPMHLPCTLERIGDEVTTGESTIRAVAANIVINFLFISVSCSTFFLQTKLFVPPPADRRQSDRRSQPVQRHASGERNYRKLHRHGRGGYSKTTLIRRAHLILTQTRRFPIFAT